MKKMKRIFILLMILAYIYCTFDSCDSEEDPSKCQSHSIEISDMSCYLYEEKNEKHCQAYPDDKNLQKLILKYGIGIMKETFSMMENDYDENGKKTFDIDKDLDKENISKPEKDTYNKGETIKIKDFPMKDFLTSNDIKIIKDGNTCYNRYYQNLKKLKVKSLNNSTCLNVDEFEDIKDLLECGVATGEITYKNKDYKFYNCFHMADKNADPKFKQFYYEFYSLTFFQQLKEEILQEFVEEVGQYLKVNNLKKRKLEVPMDYDFKLKVEDKYGNIVIFDKNGKIIDEPTKFLYSSLYSLNIFLFLLNLLFLL